MVWTTYSRCVESCVPNADGRRHTKRRASTYTPHERPRRPTGFSARESYVRSVDGSSTTVIFMSEYDF
jgi:hypothetical protein